MAEISDLVALVARLRAAVFDGPLLLNAADALEQLQAELAESKALCAAISMGIRGLAKERDTAKDDLAYAASTGDECAINVQALRAELAAVKADSERYRWLKANHLQTGNDSWIRTGEDLEEAVDSARAQAGGE